MKNHKFTIFTSCYNSEKFIQRVFDSLDQQTYRNFEWIVFDDCSTDNTIEVVKKYLSERNFPHQLIINEKNRRVSFNRKEAIKKASGDFFITWDHDDIASSDQLEFFNTTWNEFGSEKIAAIASSCQDQHNNLVGKKFPKETFVSNYFTLFEDYLFFGKESHMCVRTDIAKKYTEKHKKFDVFYDGSILWGKIATEFDFIFTNKVLRTYFIDASNVNAMTNQNREKMASVVYRQKAVWVNELNDSVKSSKMKMRFSFAHVMYGIMADLSLNELLRNLNKTKDKITAFFMYPAVYLFAKYFSKK